MVLDNKGRDGRKRCYGLAVQSATLYAQTVLPSREPGIPIPNKFDGDHNNVCGFRNHCWVLFMFWPQSFSTDQTQVRLITRLLTKDALVWPSPLLETFNPLLKQFKEFIQTMAIVFDDPNCTLSAKNALAWLLIKQHL
uniref:DUF4939 domain-containing protein n=1 Tax=Chrysemys picta bellii TaxID=8478 RepID=A0A8C3FFE5_CHRPI